MAGPSAIISPIALLSRWIKYHCAPFTLDRDGKIDRQDNRMMGRIMSRLLKSDSNCVEIGANMGGQLGQILQHASRGTHFAFEPQPEMAKSLAAAFPNVRVREIALSDRDGEAEFSQCLSTPGWSGFKKWNSSAGQKTQSIRVQMRTLDGILPADHVVRFIKIDVEGAELQVLRGATETIRRSNPYILFEHGVGAADAYGTTPEMIFDFFAGESYAICGLAAFLRAEKPFTREQFGETFRRHDAWNFIAYPANAAPVARPSLWQRIQNALGAEEPDSDAETALIE